ncbi:MAG: tetratricopeptide repeat protein [Brevinema sp.]
MRFSLFFLLLLPLINVSFAQTTKLAQTQDSNTNSTILPEIAELRLAFFDKGLSQEQLFRLASFYLSAQCYAKAAEIYGLFLSQKTENPHRAIAHYNRALALFSLKAYESSAKEYWYAYEQNTNIYNALRMLGSIAFLKKDKNNSLRYWKKYLVENTNTCTERSAIEQAVTLLESTNFSFNNHDPENLVEEHSDTNWPFKNPDTLPYPDALFKKKRVI